MNNQTIYSIEIYEDSMGYSYRLYNQLAEGIGEFRYSWKNVYVGWSMEGTDISEYNVDQEIQVNKWPGGNLTGKEHEIKEIISSAWKERGIKDKHGFFSLCWKGIKRDYGNAHNIQGLPVGILAISPDILRQHIKKLSEIVSPSKEIIQQQRMIVDQYRNKSSRSKDEQNKLDEARRILEIPYKVGFDLCSFLLNPCSKEIEIIKEPVEPKPVPRSGVFDE